MVRVRVWDFCRTGTSHIVIELLLSGALVEPIRLQFLTHFGRVPTRSRIGNRDCSRYSLSSTFHSTPWLSWLGWATVSHTLFSPEVQYSDCQTAVLSANGALNCVILPPYAFQTVSSSGSRRVNTHVIIKTLPPTAVNLNLYPDLLLIKSSLFCTRISTLKSDSANIGLNTKMKFWPEWVKGGELAYFGASSLLPRVLFFLARHYAFVLLALPLKGSLFNIQFVDRFGFL
jgi:hypothetical protein